MTEIYIRCLSTRLTRLRLENGCKLSVIPQRDLQFVKDGIARSSPLAPHLSIKLANGEQRVWVECEVEDYVTYNRPESQGGTWVLAQKMKIVRELTTEEVRQILESAA